MLDHEGYLAWFRREQLPGRLVLHPGERVFHDGKSPLRPAAGTAGKSGRRKLCVVDWDADGDLDFLINSKNVNLLRNAGAEDGRVLLEEEGPLAERRLAGHTTSPTMIDLDGDGGRELVLGVEDGFLYVLGNE